MSSLYDVLGIRRDATPDDIRRAYRRKAMQWHPDRNSSPEAADKFKLANRANEVLSDPARRRQYDASGGTGLEEQQPQQHMSQFHPFGGVFRTRPFDGFGGQPFGAFDFDVFGAASPFGGFDTGGGVSESVQTQTRVVNGVRVTTTRRTTRMPDGSVRTTVTEQRH